MQDFVLDHLQPAGQCLDEVGSGALARHGLSLPPPACVILDTAAGAAPQYRLTAMRTGVRALVSGRSAMTQGSGSVVLRGGTVLTVDGGTVLV